MSAKLVVIVLFILCMALWFLTLLGAITFGASGWIPFFAVLLLAAMDFAPGKPTT
jgi:hypothetical protein